MSDNGLSLFRSCLKITLKARFTHLPTKFPEEPFLFFGRPFARRPANGFCCLECSFIGTYSER